MNNDLDNYAVRKLHIMIPEAIFDKLCKTGKIKEIDTIVTRLLINELKEDDNNGRNRKQY